MTSIIILSFNSADFTFKCIETIRQHVMPDTYEIIVVDNGSVPDDGAKLIEASNSMGFTLVRSKINVGFGAGNMLGANQAKGDYLCFLNNDTELFEDSINPLCQFLREHNDVGCITPQEYNIENRRVRAHKHGISLRQALLGDVILNKFNPRKYPKRGADFKGEPIYPVEISGSFLMFPADAFHAIGGFDINIFLYYEEYDTAMRLRKIGKRVCVFTKYGYRHVHGASMRKHKSPTYTELQISKIYCYTKHHNILCSVLFRANCIISVLVKPKKWYLLKTIIHGNILSQSMRHRIQQ